MNGNMKRNDAAVVQKDSLVHDRISIARYTNTARLNALQTQIAESVGRAS